MDRASATEPSRGEGVSPSIAFIVGLVLIAALAGAWMLARPENPTAVTGKPSGVIEEPDYSLTNAEAIAQFKELESAYIGIYRSLSLTGLDEIYTATSPLRDLVRRDVEKLQGDQIRDRSRFITVDLRVLVNSNDRIVVEQKLEFHPRFLSKSGQRLEISDPQSELVRWTLRSVNGTWLIHDSVVKEVRPL